MVQSLSVEPSTTLSAPVGHLMRPTLTCPAEDTIQRGLGELRRNGGGVLPIVRDGCLVGCLTESALTHVLAVGMDVHEGCAEAMTEAITIPPYASGAEALRMLSEMNLPTLVVVDDARKVLGLISPSDLYARRRALPRPEQVGGMATPFGVYLTSGGLSGGPTLWAVMGTGGLMLTMMLVGQIAAVYAGMALDKTQLLELPKNIICATIMWGGFAGLMRLLPLSGIHGAEHMVVHAIERGEDLTPEVVARMPRVHPRCGTNLAAGMFLFLSIFIPNWGPDNARLLVAALVTLFCWRPLGSFAQQYITTKKPNEKQIRSGIKAGTELIERYSTAHFRTSSIPQRFWNSGLLHVIAGRVLTLALIQGLMWLLHIKVPGLDMALN